jgi:MFS family permease
MNEARGYFNILHNRNFLVLWLGQILSQIALNSSPFVTIILIEKVTQSTAQDAAVIVAYSLPAVLLAAVAGIVVDRISKKNILVVSNGLRVITLIVLALVAALAVEEQIAPALFLSLIYVFLFISSAIGQFFAPAEGATIPRLVNREDLLSANSLFTLTVIATQVLSLVVIVPLATKTIGVVGTLLLLSAFYFGATALVMLLPRSVTPVRGSLEARSITKQAWSEIVEGWHFTISHSPIFLGILQFSLVGFLVFAMAVLAPSYANRVLGLAPEDAVFVFSPAGAGMLIASGLVVRYGPRVSRHALPIAGMVIMGLSLFGLGLVGRLGNGKTAPLVQLLPGVTTGGAILIGIAAFFAGIALALILIPTQTVVQEESPDEIRGRVLTVQFTLANALGLPPLLAVGGLADLYGVSTVTLALALAVLAIAVINYLYVRGQEKRWRARIVAQGFPLPGADASAVRHGENGSELLEQPTSDMSQEK